MSQPKGLATPFTTVAVIVATQLVGVADDVPEFGKPFDAAVGEIAERCDKVEASVLLIAVREEAGLDDVPKELTTTLFESFETGLAKRSPDLTVRPCPLGDDSPLDHEAKRVLTTRELRDLADVHEFDLVLDATYRSSRGKPSLRLALFDPQRRLFLKHVLLDDEDVDRAIARHRARRPRPVQGAADGGDPRRRRDATNADRNVAASNTAGRPIRPGEGGRPGMGPGGEGNGPDDPPGDVPPGDATGLNKRVLEFAQRNFGQRVGNGECWTLANEALKAAGARPAAGYTFGRGIDRKVATAGDVLQFKSVRVERGNRYWTLGTPHHTAIIEGIDGDVVTVLHQNFGTRTVTRFTFDFGNVVRGDIHAYRPRP